MTDEEREYTLGHDSVDGPPGEFTDFNARWLARNAEALRAQAKHPANKPQERDNG